ncbi:MAG: SpoIVB peptidase, partial [Oscillospiraceae bacterium]|nr:SpoIVB peptidase [Oscillospiraceae bacterium]
ENRTRQVAAERGTGIYTASLFGVFPLKEVAVIQSEQRYVSVSGKPFGIKMFCDGVMLVGFSDILTRTGYQNPAKTAGLKTGDVITHINDKKVQTNEDVERIILKSGVSPLKVSYIRDDTERTAMLMAVKDSNTGALRTGMWVRDSGAGIGTMTFFDSITGCFGGLGHGIKDVDTQKELRLLSGEIVPVKITGIVKSKNGSAGQLKGSFLSTMASGKVLENGKTGVYGRAYTRETDNMMPVATPGQIKTGKAYILTTISGTEPHMYEVEIEKVNLTANDRNKNMVIRITDSRLLSLTGGIVAGMSGSPIIQDGMLVGAVTHVFVNQVERGYAIFAQNMLETMDSVAEAKKYIA